MKRALKVADDDADGGDVVFLLLTCVYTFELLFFAVVFSGFTSRFVAFILVRI